MAGKRVKTTTRSRESSQLSLAEAIRSHADAIRKLADTVTATRAPEGVHIAAAAAGGAVAALAPLSRVQILSELAKIWGASSVKESDDIYKYFAGGPGAVAAFWEPLCDWPPFKERHLHLGPNDLRFVTKVGELVDVIAWGLRSGR